MAEGQHGNPGVVGLAGFALSTFLLNLHNLGVMNVGPVLAMGVLYGGIAQFVAGFFEKAEGNNFGFTAFVSYGCFWIGLIYIIWNNEENPDSWSYTDDNSFGWYIFAWLIYTGILTVASFKIHHAMAFLLVMTFFGFGFLDIALFFPGDGAHLWVVLSALSFIVCGITAWYIMASIIINPLYGREVLPTSFGKKKEFSEGNDRKRRTSSRKKPSKKRLNSATKTDDEELTTDFSLDK